MLRVSLRYIDLPFANKTIRDDCSVKKMIGILTGQLNNPRRKQYMLKGVSYNVKVEAGVPCIRRFGYDGERTDYNQQADHTFIIRPAGVLVQSGSFTTISLTMKDDDINALQQQLQTVRDEQIEPLIDQLDDLSEQLRQAERYEDAQDVRKQLNSLKSLAVELIELLDEAPELDEQIEALKERVEELQTVADEVESTGDRDDDVNQRLGRFISYQDEQT